MSRVPRPIAIAVLGVLAACERPDVSRERADTALPAPTLVTAPASAIGDTPRASVSLTPFRTIGRRATAAEIRAWDIDVNASGVGLPAGSGSYARGAAVFAQQCASCHGARGEGLATNPRLIGAEPRDFSFALDPKIPKTIGNYWPYATTLYDYINRAMPFTAPSSLPANDVYSVVAYLLAENGVIDRSRTIDAVSLPRVRMPARDRFVPDDRTGARGFR
ncbi:MAG TPA: cytochrome c [Gemmatimonadaceae bacterium]|nr:cytochrome c [Gemmatimonadaceae bacterium]